MPSVEQFQLTQAALRWPYLGGEDSYGDPAINTTPQQLSPRNDPANGVRWTTKRTLSRDSKGVLVELDAQVVLTDRVQINDLLWLGTIEQWEETKPVQEVMIVVNYSEVPDLKGNNFTRTAGLMRYKNM